MNPFQLKNWPPLTGLLHFFLAFFTTLQILTSLFTDYHLGILIHGFGGIGLFLVTGCHWLWNFFHENGKMLSHLFPYRKEHFHNVKQDFQNLLKKRLPNTGYQRGLPGLVEGLGLLVVTAMALTGLPVFIGYLVQKGLLSSLVVKVFDIHSFLATFVWIYWFGHVGMACIQAIMDRKRKTD